MSGEVSEPGSVEHRILHGMAIADGQSWGCACGHNLAVAPASATAIDAAMRKHLATAQPPSAPQPEAGSVVAAAAEGRYWLATTPEGSDVPLWGPDEAGDYRDDSDGRTDWWDRGSLTDMRPAMVVEEPDEARIRAIVDRHMREIAAPVSAAGADEALRQRLTRIFDLESAGDDPWRLDLMCAALSAHQAREVAAAEERGRRAGLEEAARSLNTDPSAVVAILQDDARREMAEHRSRLADEGAPTTTDEEGLT